MTKDYYTNVSTRYGKIYYRGYHIDESGNKKRVHGKLSHKPTLYLNSDKPTEFKSLYDRYLQKKEFESIPLAREFIKSHKDVMDIYGYDTNKFEYEFVARSFPELLEVLISDITVGSIDIETTTEHGKIDAVNVPEEILLITYQNIKTKKIYTFGSRPSKSDNYTLCENEPDLLRKFIRCIQDDDPDIITGWNSNSFDIPYIVNKSIKLLGEEETNRLSPFGNIDIRDKEYQGKIEQEITIVGRSCLDMLEMYKKFTLVKRENYRLDTITRIELGEGKLENKYSSFREWYESDFTEFTNYNQIDVVRVSQLEDKLGLISLVIAVAYLTKCNYEDVFSPVKYWECYILSELCKENTFVAIKRKHASAKHLDGAYVMEPKPGFYDWVVSFDGASLYPSIIKGLNMSPETLIEQLEEVTIESLLAGAHNFSGSDFTIAANGTKFKNTNEGVMPRLVSNVLDGRKKAKTLMLEAKQNYENTKDEKYKKIAELQNTLQAALKVCGNSLFGICGNAGFIFFDHRIAEGITHTGQYILRYIGEFVNNKFNEFFKTKNVKYLIYGDTDSIYFTFGNIVEKYYKDKSPIEITSALDKLIEGHLKQFIKEATDNIANVQNYYDKTIVFKREAISSGGFFLAKKKYALKVYNNEGVEYKEGDYKILGLEVVRSSTPEIARDALRECVKLVIDKDIVTLRGLVKSTHDAFKTVDIERIAFPRGANNLKEYSSNETIYSKGCPIAVRGALLHNHFIKELGADGKYQPIEEGSKLLFIYLKEPNHFKENVIAFDGKLPIEFNLHKYVDRETQFQKVFLAPLEGIMTAVGWSLVEKTNLDEFFG